MKDGTEVGLKHSKTEVVLAKKIGWKNKNMRVSAWLLHWVV